MTIPQLTKENIIEALKYIDEHGVPARNKSTSYELITEEGKKYPPKYVLNLACDLTLGKKISVDAFNSIEANAYLSKLGFSVESKQEKFKLIITADSIESTDERFTIEDLGLGDYYEPIDTSFLSSDGTETKRKRNKSEKRISNQTLPRLVCQIFENQLSSMSDLDKKDFPICRYKPEQPLICGLFRTKEEFKAYRNTIEYMSYSREGGATFYFYAWNLFSTLLFVQECLKRFGVEGDQFILIYRDKSKKELEIDKDVIVENEYKNPYSRLLLESKNIIFRGAPGTGKSYLAKQVAADIITNGYTDSYSDLTEEQKKQFEFVQFHPSYDYSDFVEGLRPKMNDDGTMGFELQDGIFKSFVLRARKNYEDSQKSKEVIEHEISIQESMSTFFEEIGDMNTVFKTVNGTEFYILNVDETNVDIAIPKNESVNTIRIKVDEIKRLLEAEIDFEKVRDITNYFGGEYTQQRFSYEFALYKEILSRKEKLEKPVAKVEELKKYIFVIDEINRGEISKILGELFFSIDPGYRGESGSVSTQYSNMHSNQNEKFFIPENVYIIGTMNDIDRSVDSFDFAMRRRFRFIEIKAEATQSMLESLEDEDIKNEAVSRMDRLNAEILRVDDLNENYQIGASYFLKLKTLGFDELWTDYLCPLLQDYVRGLYDEEGIMKRFARAYGYEPKIKGEVDETIQN